MLDSSPRSTASERRRNKSFSTLLRKNRGFLTDDHSNNSSPAYSSHLNPRKNSSRYNRNGSVGTASSASDPSSAAGSAFSAGSSFSSGNYVKDLPGGRTVGTYPPLSKQDSLESYAPSDDDRRSSRKADAVRRRIMARRSSRKGRNPSPAESDGYDSAYERQSESPPPRRGSLKSKVHGYSKSASNLLEKRSSIQSPRKSAPNARMMFKGARSPAQSPRGNSDDDCKERSSPYRRTSPRERYGSPDRDRSNTPVQRTRYSQEQEYTPKQSRGDSERRGRKMGQDRHSQTERSTSSTGYRKPRKTSPSGARPRRSSGGDRTERRSSYESPRAGLNKATRHSRSRSPRIVQRKRRADTYPSPKHDTRTPSPLQRRSRSPKPKPRRQRSLTPPARTSRSPYGGSRARSPSAPDIKTYRLSELIPECRLYHIEARGGRRDFRKWFSTLPPNVKVDKDMKTDRGVFKKDNFATDKKLDDYLGINRSRSPKDDRRKGRY